MRCSLLSGKLGPLLTSSLLAPVQPQQLNGYDCGVFSCHFLEAVSIGGGAGTWSFGQESASKTGAADSISLISFSLCLRHALPSQADDARDRPGQAAQPSRLEILSSSSFDRAPPTSLLDIRGRRAQPTAGDSSSPVGLGWRLRQPRISRTVHSCSDRGKTQRRHRALRILSCAPLFPARHDVVTNRSDAARLADVNRVDTEGSSLRTTGCVQQKIGRGQGREHLQRVNSRRQQGRKVRRRWRVCVCL